MKTAGIIAEYNPFHNGHKYHLEKTREITNADYIIAVISGNFTQRGLPAMIDKYSRAEMALKCGADLVLELPSCYALGSAEFFSTGAVTLLDKLGVTDSLCFGSEAGDLTMLTHIAEILNDEPEQYQDILKNNLKTGYSFPKSRDLALGEYLKTSSAGIPMENLLSVPNNILGMEYIRALKKRNSKIIPYTITRQGAAYHDKDLSEKIWEENAVRSSASAIRTILEEQLENNLDLKADYETALTSIADHIPKEVYQILYRNAPRTFPVTGQHFSLILQYKLLSEAKKGYTDYMDVSPDLSDKIKKNLNNYKTFAGFCDLLKSKDLTYTRICRALLHILLNITKEKVASYVRNDYITYARILGFRKGSEPLLRSIKENASVPVISKLADASSLLNDFAFSMLEEDIWASNLYESVVADHYHAPFINEYSKPIIII